MSTLSLVLSAPKPEGAAYNTVDHPMEFVDLMHLMKDITHLEHEIADVAYDYFDEGHDDTPMYGIHEWARH